MNNLYVWNWDGGEGFNQTIASSMKEATKIAKSMWIGHKPTNIRKLNKIEEKEYWKNFPLID